LISATFDTNVYMRGLHFGGPGASLLAAAKDGSFQLDVSEPILNVTARVQTAADTLIFYRNGATIVLSAYERTGSANGPWR
jgi:hypothetical protein